MTLNRWIILPLVLTLAGCASRRPATAPKPALRALGQAVTTAETSSDESIGAEIRRRMDIADAAGTAGVVIEVEAGVVTLRGSANGLTGAWRAESVAHSVPGVKDVRNQIIQQPRGGL